MTEEVIGNGYDVKELDMQCYCWIANKILRLNILFL
jgi:hypothetical protein